MQSKAFIELIKSRDNEDKHIQDVINNLKEIEKRHKGHLEEMHIECDRILLDNVDPRIKNEFNRINDENGFWYA